MRRGFARADRERINPGVALPWVGGSRLGERMRVSPVRVSPVRVSPVLVALVAGWMAACSPGLQAASFPELLEEAIERGLPGIVVVVDHPDGERAFRGAAGQARRAPHVPMTVDTGFRIASNSKAFVGLVLAGLHVDGLVDLDAPIVSMLEEADIADMANARTATLRQVLQHTSGIADYLDGDAFWDRVERGRTQPWTIREALAFARGAPPVFAPGEGWDYSNTNYLLAGLVIERATGGGWGEAVRGRVLDPLGMTLSFVENEEPPRVAIAHGYSRGRRDMHDVDTGYGLPDGGVVATAPELARFMRAVGGGAAPDGVSPEALALMRQAPAAAGGGERYGLGISELATPCGRTFGHGGNLEGYLSEMFHVPDRDVTIVVFVNASDGRIDDLFGAVVDRALELACAE